MALRAQKPSPCLEIILQMIPAVMFEVFVSESVNEAAESLHLHFIHIIGEIAGDIEFRHGRHGNHDQQAGA